ncbi:MAG: alpha-L-glutamate ligase-like protein [Myxococcota bacterium]
MTTSERPGAPEPPKRRRRFRWPGTVLREAGILGMNERNASFIRAENPRRLFPLVDDKAKTKDLAAKAGIAFPELYGLIRSDAEARNFPKIVEGKQKFVVKPAHGSGGNGIVVIRSVRNGRYFRANGTFLDEQGMEHHLSNILSGMYSLGGRPDQVLIERCVEFDPIFDEVTFQGVPDIRTIVYRGYPVAAMVRLPTRRSDGKANLHQGAVGSGVDLKTGVTTHAILAGKPVTHHPDTGHVLTGIQIPGWRDLLVLAAHCHDVIPLGYLGVDIVLDRDFGPLVLELNARPGLAIQMANGRGLRPLLERIRALPRVPTTAQQRAAFAMGEWSGPSADPPPVDGEAPRANAPAA